MKTIKISEPIDLHIFLSDFYESIVYDNSPEFKEYVPTGIWFTLYENECVAGFINLEPLNNVMWTSHVMIYESFRGKGSEEWAVQAAWWMRENVGATKFLAITPHEAAKNYAERAGFTLIGVLSNSIKKNGKLLNQYMLELGEEE